MAPSRARADKDALFTNLRGGLNQILYRNDGKVNFVPHSGCIDHVLVVATEAWVGVDVIVVTHIIRAFVMFRQDDDLARIAIHKVNGRGATAEEAVVGITDNEPTVAAAVRMPALPREGDFFHLTICDSHPPSFVIVDGVNTPDMLPVCIPPLMGNKARLT